MFEANDNLIITLLAAAAVVVAVLAWRFPKRSDPDSGAGASQRIVYGRSESPTIHATSGVPTLQQLTEGMELSPKAMGLAERLYEGGLAQFVHDVNNRDGIIEESRRNMTELASSLSTPEVSQAEEAGVALAESNNAAAQQAAKDRTRDLTLDGRKYAQHKCREHDAQIRITRDLEKGVPRTDYTAVRRLIAEGSATLDSIISDLPIQWQAIRALNDKVDRPDTIRKPPRREFLHVMFITSDMGILEDRKAERDGNWIISNRHNMVVPYRDPIPLLEFRHPNQRPVPAGEMIVIDDEPGSEWDTELWRQGGYMDQVYLRARSGTSPDQLRRAYRKRQLKILSWVVAGALVLANIVVWVVRYPL